MCVRACVCVYVHVYVYVCVIHMLETTTMLGGKLIQRSVVKITSEVKSQPNSCLITMANVAIVHVPVIK